MGSCASHLSMTGNNVDWKMKMKGLQDMLGSMSEEERNSEYFSDNLLDLYDMMVRVNQGRMDFEEPTKVKRVIRINRYVPNYKLDYYNEEYVIVDGLFLLADAYVMPHEILKSCKKKDGCYGGKSLKEYGAPTSKDYLYCSYNVVSKDHIMVIKKTWLEDRLTYRRSWSYVD